MSHARGTNTEEVDGPGAPRLKSTSEIRRTCSRPARFRQRKRDDLFAVPVTRNKSAPFAMSEQAMSNQSVILKNWR
jgi:hypothetical protein